MKIIDLILVVIQLVLFIVYVIIPTGPAAGLFFQTLAFICTITGIIIAGLAILNLKNSLTPFPTPKSSNILVTNHVYKYIRHPIYTGIILTVCGMAIYSLNPARGILSLIIYVFFHYKSKYEEKMLIDRYPQYQDYLKKTGRFLPKFFNV